VFLFFCGFCGLCLDLYGVGFDFDAFDVDLGFAGLD